MTKYIVTVNSRFKHKVEVDADNIHEAKYKAELWVADNHDDYSRLEFVEIKAGQARLNKAKEVAHEE
mgnify:CR=1 FL=1